MPVGARGNQNRIDVLAVQQVPEIAIRVAVLVAILGIGNFLDGNSTGFFHIADGDELNVFLFQKTAEVICSSIPDPDPADDNALTGGGGSVQAEGRARDDRRYCEDSTRRKRGLQKLTPTKLIDVFRHESSPARLMGRSFDGTTAETSIRMSRSPTEFRTAYRDGERNCYS